MSVSTARSVDPAWLAERLGGTGEPPRVVDVRTPAEFETVHVPGSFNVPLDTLREHRRQLGEVLGEDVVLVCRSGQRAARAGEALGEVGLDGARVLEGGIVAWEAQGRPVARGRKRWELERQVRLVAGSIVLTAVLVGRRVPAVTWVAGGIGAGLTFAALSDTCAMGMLLAKLPYNRGPERDPREVIAELAAERDRG